MPKRPDFEPFQRGARWLVSIPPSMTSTGKRVRKTFATKTAAEKYGARLRATHESGVRGGMVSASLALQAQEAETILSGTGISIVEAARMAAGRVKDAAGSERFKDRYDRAVRAGEGHWRPRYMADMERLPNWVPRWFMDLPCGAIDRADMERALVDGRKIARSTIDARSRYISAVIGYRDRHRKSATIEILSVAACARLLRECTQRDEVRAVAVLLFAGIRPDADSGEITKLDWQDVGAVEIRVHPDTSKTGSDRLIPVTPRLRRLIRGHPAEGPVAPAGWKRRWARIRKAAGITGQDVTRHTFASNFLAAFGEDAAKQAMGHTAGSSTLFRHYRRAVSKDAGNAYFR